MDKGNQLKSDRERLAALIGKYTGISSKRLYGFIAENGVGELMSSANRLARTDAQREKISSLIEFKNLYAIVKGAEQGRAHILGNTEAAMDYFISYFADKNDRERVAAAFLDSKNMVIATKVMSAGAINEASVNTREIARESLFYNASSVILAHNHPSGVTLPSQQDGDVTARTMSSLNAVGVKLHDHIVVAGGSATSMADLGHIDMYNLEAEAGKAASPVSQTGSAYTTNEKTKEASTTMSDDTAGAGAATTATGAPLLENEHVKELFAILRDNGRDAAGLSALISHVQGMEDFVKAAEGKIADMKAQLDTMKEIQDHPVKAKLQKAVKALETAVTEIKAQIVELKKNIAEGCKSAVAAFEEKGAAALDKLASFFKIREGLESIKNSTAKSAGQCDKSIAQVEAFSKEYHESGRHVKNMARVLVGKEPIDTAKEPGRLAKAVNAPARAHKACLLSIGRQADKMIGALDKLDKGVDAKLGAKAADSKDKKPTLMERLESKKNEIKQRELEKPPMERERAPKSKGLEV